MHRYFFLAGLFLVIETSHLTSAHLLSLFRVHAKEEQAAKQLAQEQIENDIDSVNELEDSPIEDDIRSSGHNNFKDSFVTVKLEGENQVIKMKEGESYELECTVDARPEQQVYWIRSEKYPSEKIDELINENVLGKLSDSLSRVKSKYVIDCASEKHEGRVFCVGISGKKKQVQWTDIAVKKNRSGLSSCQMKRERSPVITRYASTIFLMEGSNVVLPCEAIGTPRPKIHWFDNDDEEIVNSYDSRYTIFPNGDLLIKDIKWDDMGGIKCIAKSILGIDSAETFLYPLSDSSFKL